jgi:hypothetical protein
VSEAVLFIVGAVLVLRAGWADDTSAGTATAEASPVDVGVQHREVRIAV